VREICNDDANRSMRTDVYVHQGATVKGKRKRKRGDEGRKKSFGDGPGRNKNKKRSSRSPESLGSLTRNA
jgi:hypothetical protein